MAALNILRFQLPLLKSVFMFFSVCIPVETDPHSGLARAPHFMVDLARVYTNGDNFQDPADKALFSRDKVF